MITEKQIEVINTYVPEKYFEREKLIKYLTLHDKVGVEIFEYVAKTYDKPTKGFETVLPGLFKDRKREIDPEKEEFYRISDVVFEPEDVDIFVRRIPFNFYHRGDDIRVDEDGTETLVWRPVEITELTYALGAEPFSTMYYHRRAPLMLEDAYEKLEYLFYDRGFSIEEIFDYPASITWTDSSDMYGDWFDYIDMCLQLGWEDVMPKQFYYKYNLAREALGIEPIIFPIMEYDCEAWARDREQVKFYKRKGNKLEFFGVFPCDENNQPVLRWIAVDIKDAESVICSGKNELECFMTVTLTPKTVIHAQITERDEVGNELPGADPEWVQIYAGPQTMTFNYKLLKEKRTELGYTQQEVADAVQANVRTYQKWGSGETKPDGYYLLRILNWLDIPNINDVILYENAE